MKDDAMKDDDQISTWEEGRAAYLRHMANFPLEADPATGVVLTVREFQELVADDLAAGGPVRAATSWNSTPDAAKWALGMRWLAAQGVQDDDPGRLKLMIGYGYAQKREAVRSVLAGSDFWLPERFHPAGGPTEPAYHHIPSPDDEYL
jgi:hypothetical protein